MVNDSIKIRDGYVINIGVDFDIVILPNNNSNDVNNKDAMYSTSYNYQYEIAKTDNELVNKSNLGGERKFKTYV
jgi:hypothetical protein